MRMKKNGRFEKVSSQQIAALPHRQLTMEKGANLSSNDGTWNEVEMSKIHLLVLVWLQ